MHKGKKNTCRSTNPIKPNCQCPPFFFYHILTAFNKLKIRFSSSFMGQALKKPDQSPVYLW